MTIIGIYAQNHGLDVTKTMSANPRCIGRLEVVFTMPRWAYSAKDQY